MIDSFEHHVVSALSAEHVTPDGLAPGLLTALSSQLEFMAHAVLKSGKDIDPELVADLLFEMSRRARHGGRLHSLLNDAKAHAVVDRMAERASKEGVSQ